MKVESLQELAEHLDITVPADADLQPFKALIEAIKAGRIVYNAEPDTVTVELKKPVLLQGENEATATVRIPRVSGKVRRLMMNGTDRTRGDTFYKALSELSRVRASALDDMDSQEVALLESIFSLRMGGLDFVG